MSRRWELDALRGLMLVLMTVTHLPTQWADPLGQPFGYVSAAEGFVLLSGFMAGLVYTGMARRQGGDEMRLAFVRRAVKVYGCQVGLLLFLLSVVALLGLLLDQPAINNLIAYYLERPWAALFSGLLLVYAPPLLDILPMYVLFLLASPVILLHGLRQGWGPVLALSTAVWLAAQFGAGAWLYAAASVGIGLPVPYNQTGAFDTLAWQLLWVLGLWMGSVQASGAPAPIVFPRWMVLLALAFAALSLVWRHAVGQVPFPGQAGWNLAFDKWQLGPLRLINVFALMILLMHFAEPLVRHLPRVRPLEALGAASLPVFCAHLVLVLLALALFGPADAQRPLGLDLALLLGTGLALYGVALASAQIDRRAARLKARLPALRRLASAQAGGHRPR